MIPPGFEMFRQLVEITLMKSSPVNVGVAPVLVDHIPGVDTIELVSMLESSTEGNDVCNGSHGFGCLEAWTEGSISEK
jgi:hypothetical protein